MLQLRPLTSLHLAPEPKPFKPSLSEFRALLAEEKTLNPRALKSKAVAEMFEKKAAEALAAMREATREQSELQPIYKGVGLMRL